MMPRLLLAFSSVILTAGGVMHAMAFNRTASAVAESNLPTFFANSLRALWLIDSATLMTLAVAFGSIAARPSRATRGVVMILAIIPGATAFFLSSRPTCSSPQRLWRSSAGCGCSTRRLSAEPGVDRRLYHELDIVPI